MLLDRLLASLDIHVEPFSLCEVSPRRALRLPGSERAMLHFVLTGKGFIRSASGEAQPVGPCTLAVVPKGARHSLEPGGEIAEECQVADSEAVPGAPVIAGPSTGPPEMIAACGLVKVRFGSALEVFDQLEQILVEDFFDTPQVRDAFKDILAEQLDGGPGSEAMKAALMSQCIVFLFRRLCAPVPARCPGSWL